jgi:glyoxylase-like metal-dependent hydrolase (beta-lactamase superfamily II)
VHFERFESALWETSSLLLVAGDEAVAIDPCISADEVARIADRAATLGARVTHVLVTHADWDHYCGIGAFPAAVAAMGAATAEIVAGEDSLEVLSTRSTEYGLTIEGAPRVDASLDIGSAHRIGPFVVETVALRGHTADGTAYRIRDLDLFAVGDHLSAAEFPFVSSASEYRATLAALIDAPGDRSPGTRRARSRPRPDQRRGSGDRPSRSRLSAGVARRRCQRSRRPRSGTGSRARRRATSVRRLTISQSCT